jgi:uncharacterized protein (DUF2062 family)
MPAGNAVRVMSSEFERHRREEMVRKRRVRRLLRPLPRRANLARYPVIRWFRDIAGRAPYLWSFKQRHVLPAIYAGTIIAFLPLYGFQFLLAFAAALLLRGNLTLMVGLQLITNPFTILPIFAFTGWLGLAIMNALGIGTELGPIIRGANSLFVGGMITGLGCALLLDIAYRIGLWESRRFKAHGQRLRALLHLPTARANASEPEPDPGEPGAR